MHDGGLQRRDARAAEGGAALFGFVAIGRNEGERLKSCLASLAREGAPIVYVDSGSTDDSVAAARRLGAEVVELDLSIPFTAARARNAGAARLIAIAPQAEYIHFIDGDCEIASGWPDAAAAFLSAHADYGAACGRRREKFPDKSPYNRLCDEEWCTPVGEAEGFGGEALIRRRAFEAVGGYREQLIAAEDTELGARLREAGFRIMRLDLDSSRHDAAIHSFSQWWRRSMRAGYAFAEVSQLHRRSPTGIFKREVARPFLWTGFGLATLLLGSLVSPLAFLLLLAYPAQIWRIRAARQRLDPPTSWTTACLLGLAKFAEMQGILKYWTMRLRGRRSGIIEYKK